jgi:alginate O-acetyltransferase complex protein AlgI
MITTREPLLRTSPIKPPAKVTRQATVSTPRLVIAWTALLGGMVGYWCLRPWCAALAWADSTGAVLWVTSKIATLVCMPPDDRRRLGWVRFTAYLLWPGMQPGHFLPERTPADSRPAPTVSGMLVNALTAVLLLWVLPALMPADWPRWLRFLSGAVGDGFLILFALFDAWALLYRACGVGVEKLWLCPIAATSLSDFWGQRWNRIFSGMFREVLFLPLTRRFGGTVALFAVFVYSGLLHEGFSVGALSGYGLPMLYFLIQGLALWLESRRPFRRLLQRRPWLGRLWTGAVVLGPVLLLFHAGFREQVMVPGLVRRGVPGLASGQP